MSSTGIETLTTAALLGTARATPAFDSLHTADAADATIGTAEHRLLAAAALESVFLTGGTLPTPYPRPGVAPDDTRPELPPAATERLLGLLTVGSDLLDEWFYAAKRFKAPGELIVDLLDKAATNSAHRMALTALAGQRGQWVAAQNPRWAPLVDPDLGDDDVWLHGTPARRRSWFQNLRGADPAAASARLAEVWTSENAATRLALIEALSPGLGSHDEQLLERALDDRSGRVREVAIRFLRRLPDSAFGRRMSQRVHEWVRVDGSILCISLPDTLDAAAVRDGLDARGPSRLGTVETHRTWSLAASASRPCPACSGPGHRGRRALQQRPTCRAVKCTGWIRPPGPTRAPAGTPTNAESGSRARDNRMATSQTLRFNQSRARSTVRPRRGSRPG